MICPAVADRCEDRSGSSVGVVAALVMVSAQAEHVGRIPSIAAFADFEDMVHVRGGLDALLEPTVLASG